MTKGKIKTIDVMQIGGREHYVLPKMFHDMGLLRYLHTDFLSDAPTFLARCLKLVPRSLFKKTIIQRARDRKSGLPPANVKSSPMFGVRHTYKQRQIWDSVEKALYQHKQWKKFADIVINNIDEPAQITLGFRGALPLFEQLEGKSKRILWQNDGGWHEANVVKEEQINNVEWISGTPDWLEAKEKGIPFWLDIEQPRLDKEWNASDLVVCNSKWTAQCVKEAGVSMNKVKIIPIAYDNKLLFSPRKKHSRPLKVGFLGIMTLRKGIHILCEAAIKAAKQSNIKVICAGSVGEIEIKKLIQYHETVDYIGKIPRSSIDSFLSKIDVLAIPSVSEGFGIVQLEAMSRGIPVISSDRTGEAVIDGVNGIKVKAGDVEELAAALSRLADDRDELENMSEAALSRAKDFSRKKMINHWQAIVKESEND